ncbi:MAG: N-6 DNA methylase [Candidatus Lokiarchaeota archaeon]|nr:N-6 DNA methylase [Candidatus Lokiarchaeota archaeon]
MNGDLFGPRSMPDLENARLLNRDFLQGFAHLSLFKDKLITRRINYAYLDVEELGSVYESLLDYQPVIENHNSEWKFNLVFGTERKSTGSYYTRPELVQELIKSALVPVMEERLRDCTTKDEKEKALLNLKICDAASGSGHFLLAAARRVGKELAKVRFEEDQPTPTQFRSAVRDIIQHCIYGVDLNPLAVDLCKVALWLEGHNKGKPLTFLDHHIKCGNSLVGVFDMGVVKKGIPDDAFKPVTGDNKEVAAAIRKRNKKERESAQIELAFEGKEAAETKYFAEAFSELANIPDDDTQKVKQKEQFYHELRDKDPNWYKQWTAANIWTAAFFCPLNNEQDPAIPTHEKLMHYLENPGAVHGQLVGMANALAQKHRFFHWQLEFPEVMNAGGFDVVLGNPPWERIKLQEQEFFATRDPEIANAPNKAARTRLIKELKKKNPGLAKEFEEAKHDAEAVSRFVRASGRFELTARGDINTYALFAEQSRELMNETGRTGVIVPTGIATDDTYKAFFADVNDTHSLVSLFDFENREKLFQAVDSRYKFSLLTLSAQAIEAAKFSFFLTRTEHLDDETRQFTLSADDIELINPNTRTVPVFRTKVDAELTKKIYQRVPVLVNERTGKSPWGISFLRMIDMANDSNLFYSEPAENRVPLYEAKMIWQYDHRFGSYEGVDPNSSSTHLPIPSADQYADPNYIVMPRYWVSKDEVVYRVSDVPSALITAFKLKNKKNILTILTDWLAGYALNNGKEKEGTDILIRKFNPAFDSIYNSVINYLAVQNFEKKYPLTFSDLNNIITLYDNPVNLAKSIIENRCPNWLMCFRDITNATNERTGIFSIVPAFGIGNNAPIILSTIKNTKKLCCLLSNFNSLVFDYLARQKIAGTHMNFFLLKQLPIIHISSYEDNYTDLMSTKVLELVYTSDSLKLFAEDMGYNGEPFTWDEDRRALLRAELDAYYAKLYGLTRDELRYILDPQDVYGPDFPGETFRVLKEKEIKKYGEYRTRRLVLEAWDRLERGELEKRSL